MFDIGFWELALIAVVALLVVGPERLPGMAREVGIWVGRVRRYVQHVRDDIETEIRNEGLKEMMQQPPGLKDLSDIANETRESIEQARDEVDGARREAGETAADAPDTLDEADTGEPRESAMFEQAAPALDEAPAAEAPTDALPADEPPADEPSANVPPADEPPADEPPADEPPADEPRTDAPRPDEPAVSKEETAASVRNETHEPER